MSTAPIRRLLAAGASGIVSALAAFARRVLDHPLEIEPIDGSAATLWPRVAEEEAPPRWPLPSA